MGGGAWWATATSLSLFTFMHWRRQWQPPPVFLPGESQGWGSLVVCRLWGRTESDTTEATQQQQQQQQSLPLSLDHGSAHSDLCFCHHISSFSDPLSPSYKTLRFRWIIQDNLPISRSLRTSAKSSTHRFHFGA